MAHSETNAVLIPILETLKQQAIFLDRQHAWIIALAETLRTDARLETRLRQHPLYDLGLEPRLRPSGETIQKLDALIRQLSDQT